MADLYAGEEVAELAKELRDPLYRFRIGRGSGREIAEVALRFLTDNGWRPPAPVPDNAPEPERHLTLVPASPKGTPEPIKRQQRLVLAELARFIEDHSHPPTIRELSAALGLSLSSVHYQLGRLAAAGWIHRGEGSRTLTVLHEPGESA